MVRKATRYEPGTAFQESGEEGMLEISPSDSTELWLIQWPINHVDASDFHGKEVSLKLHCDGNLGNLECSLVGKISRRVSLVRYPEPQELEKEKPGFGSLTPGSKKSAGSSRKTMSRFTGASKNRSSQGSAFSLGQHSADPASKHKQKKRRDESSLDHSNVSGKSSEGSQARGTESNTTSEMPQPSVEKSKKKKKKVRIAE
ncbi:hypothetical protein ACQ4PT_065625 [Festuca glaucescens]